MALAYTISLNMLYNNVLTCVPLHFKGTRRVHEFLAFLVFVLAVAVSVLAVPMSVLAV